jgi:hypothetical protein
MVSYLYIYFIVIGLSHSPIAYFRPLTSYFLLPILLLQLCTLCITFAPLEFINHSYEHIS